MFVDNVEKIKDNESLNETVKRDTFKQMERQQVLRFTDMQSVVNARLMASQQSVDNAQNYPSTWTTNPDGGANGQV
jgi:hypothetical protein